MYILLEHIFSFSQYNIELVVDADDFKFNELNKKIKIFTDNNKYDAEYINIKINY